MSQSPANERPSTRQPLLTQALREVLEQALALVGSLDEVSFSEAPEGLAKSGPGAHLRHTLDFCRRFLEGVECGRIDYDRRARDPQEETNPECAARALKGLIERLDRLDHFDSARAVEVRHDLPAEVLRSTDPEGSEWAHSSLGRELLFVLSHTIHHYALMAMCLRSRGINPGPEFGVAPSTLRYWQQSGAERTEVGEQLGTGSGKSVAELA